MGDEMERDFILLCKLRKLQFLTLTENTDFDTARHYMKTDGYLPH